MRNNPCPMKLLFFFSSSSARSIFVTSSSPSALNGRCYGRQSISTSSRPPSSSPSPPSLNGRNVGQWHHHSYRNNEEDIRNVSVKVWWDMESCQIPKGVDPYWVVHRIVSALRSHRIRGPLNITAFGDILRLSDKTRDALCTTGITLYHAPSRGMNCANRSIIADLMSWVTQNPPPAHFFLISGHRDFADILHRLRMNNYNVLIASTDGASGALSSAATIMWHWNGLVRGNEIVGRYFHYPPDGQYSSWYGNYKGALENPFLVAEEDTGLQAEYAKAAGHLRIRPIPLALVSKISDILSSNPAGIGMDDLLMNIKGTSIDLDKDYFGHKKFSNLISSIPEIAKIIPHPTIEGQHIVRSASKMSSESDPPGLRSTREEKDHFLGEKEMKHTSGDRLKSEMNGNWSSLPAEMQGKSSAELSSSVLNHCAEEYTPATDGNPSHFDIEANATLVGTSLKGAGATLKNHAVERSAGATESDANNSIPVPKNIASLKDQFLNMLRPTWLISGCRVPNDDNTSNSTISDAKHPCQHLTKGLKDSGQNIPRKYASNKLPLGLPGESPHRKESALSDFDELKSSMDKDIQSESADSHSTDTCSTQDDNASEHVKGHAVMMSISGFLQKIKMPRIFWRFLEHKGKASAVTENGLNSLSPSNITQGLPAKDVILGLQPKSHDLFAKQYFWRSMEYFLQTKQGLELVSNSTNRIDLVKGLQKQGPSILLSLEECHILHLVDLLIIKEKWIDECASQANPFKVVLPSGKTCIATNAHRENELSHIFGSADPQTSRQAVERKASPGRGCKSISSPLSTRKGQTEAPKNLEELKVWYRKVSASDVIGMNDFKKKFESDFGKRLVSLMYGYPTVKNLHAVCSASCGANRVKGPATSLLQKQVISDCQSLGAEILEKNPEGIPLSSFKLRFVEKYGYPLDGKKLGPSKVTSILKAIPGVRLESEMILPSSMLHATSDSSGHKLLSKQAIDSLVRIDQDKHSREDEDHQWDELGPPKDCEVNGHRENKLAEKRLLFEEVSVSDEDSSDVECIKSAATGCALELEEDKRKGDEETSLLQILESWHKGIESREKMQQLSVDSPADCSGKSNKNHGESDPSVLGSIKNYNFVSFEDEDMEKNKVCVVPSGHTEISSKLE